MNKIHLLSGILATSLIVGCTGEPAKEQQAEGNQKESSTQAETIKDEPEDPNALYLEGVYASSTQLPFSENGVENLFDNNKETFWSTIKGAGPDEGFMVYFREETFVKDIKLESVKKAPFAEIKMVTVYTNGKPVLYKNPTDEININSSLKSLYIRITETSNSDSERDKDGYFQVERFDENSQVNFSEITLTNKEGQPYKLVPPTKKEGNVSASSTLKPEIAYHISQLFDSRKEFVWAEGSAGGGENEIITFKINDKTKIDALQIWNGFQRSEKHYTANARIKSFEFGANGQNAIYTLQDVQEPQTITLNQPVEGNEFTLKVLEVYPGTSYKDLVVSEMRFFNGKKSFVIAGNEEEKVIKELQTKTNGTILEKVLDKRLKNNIMYDGPDADTEQRSIIVRSDYTFVVYDNASTANETKDIIADGSWELIEVSGDKAKIRVFGKLVDLSEQINIYTGNTTSSYLRIFQDFVTIDNEGIRGEKFIKKFYTTPQSIY